MGPGNHPGEPRGPQGPNNPMFLENLAKPVAKNAASTKMSSSLTKSSFESLKTNTTIHLFYNEAENDNIQCALLNPSSPEWQLKNARFRRGWFWHKGNKDVYVQGNTLSNHLQSQLILFYLRGEHME